MLEPPLLLLDEPLSNLDARLQDEMRFELKRLQHELGVTALYVTHDQAEALGISNVVGVMRAGRLEQVGTPREIYDRPASRFVADFIGAANVLDGVVEDVRNGVCDVRTAAGIVRAHAGGIARGQHVALVVRPEHVRLSAAGEGFSGTVIAEAFLGETVDRVIRVGDLELRVRSNPSRRCRAKSASRCHPRHASYCRRRLMELRDLAAYGRYAVGLRRFLREQLTGGRRPQWSPAVSSAGRIVPRRAGTRGLPEPEEPVPPAAAPRGSNMATSTSSSGGRLEATLGRLHDEGVRITLSEFKSAQLVRQPARRAWQSCTAAAARATRGG